MSIEANDLVRDSSEGGITAAHPPAVARQLFAGPATTDQVNTIRPDLRPVACCSLFDNRFDFDSSFIRPEAAREFGFLAALRKAHPNSPLSIFGHADPVGAEDYNKTLSGRRAEAVYALLIRDGQMWEQLFSHPFHGDDWGHKSIQLMLDALLFDPGRTDGVVDKQTQEAIKTFQREQGLPATGNAGSQTRPKLFLAYMDFLCRDRKGVPYKLTKQEFLAAGADPKGKGDYQGCGEANPLIVFSQQEEREFKREENKRQRDAENAPNRRVLIYLFREGTRVEPALWPCPRTKEGFGGCRKRFWSDGEARRGTHLPDRRREYKDQKETFACRFYDRFAVNSPCEVAVGAKGLLEVALFVGFDIEEDEEGVLVILDAQEQEVRTIAGARAHSKEHGFRTFLLNPQDLPNPVELSWRLTDDDEIFDRHVAGPCDPFELRDALVSGDLDRADELIQVEDESEFPPPPDIDFDDPHAETELLFARAEGDPLLSEA